MHFIKSVEQSFHQWLADEHFRVWMTMPHKSTQMRVWKHELGGTKSVCKCFKVSHVVKGQWLLIDSKHECAQSTRVHNVNVVVKHLTMFVFNNELHRFTSCIDWCKQWSWNDHWQWAMNRTQSNMNNRALTDRSTTMRVLLLCSICVMWLFWWIWVCLWRKANWCGGIDWLETKTKLTLLLFTSQKHICSVDCWMINESLFSTMCNSSKERWLSSLDGESQHNEICCDCCGDGMKRVQVFVDACAWLCDLCWFCDQSFDQSCCWASGQIECVGMWNTNDTMVIERVLNALWL